MFQKYFNNVPFHVSFLNLSSLENYNIKNCLIHETKILKIANTNGPYSYENNFITEFCLDVF